MKATSASETDTNWPTPVRVRTRSAASSPSAAVSPVAMSHAGSTWFVGRLPPRGPVA